MEVRHLRYFIVVGEEQHYLRASRRLRVAQPALSRQIQDLEEEVGFKLFDRLPRGVKLSSAGKLFLDDARRILQEVSGGCACGSRGSWAIGHLAHWVHRKCVLARRCSGLLPKISGAATRRGIATSTRTKFGTVKR